MKLCSNSLKHNCIVISLNVQEMWDAYIYLLILFFYLAIVPKEEFSFSKNASPLNKTKTSTIHTGLYKHSIKVAIKSMKLKAEFDQELLEQQMRDLPWVNLYYAFISCYIILWIYRKNKNLHSECAYLINIRR